MTGQHMSIGTSDGKDMPAYMALPDGQSGPAIVMIVPIRGVTKDMRDYADRLAAEGYCVAVPDPFWRDEDPGELPGTPEGHARGIARLGRVDPEQALVDIQSAFRHLKSLPGCNGKSAMVGFCFGGTLTLLAAERLDIDAGVAFHSGKLLHLLPDIDKVNCPLSYHWGDRDVIFPLEDIEKVRSAFAGIDSAEVIVYPGGKHSFMEQGNSDAYSADIAEAAWARGLEVLGAI